MKLKAFTPIYEFLATSQLLNLNVFGSSMWMFECLSNRIKTLARSIYSELQVWFIRFAAGESY